MKKIVALLVSAVLFAPPAFAADEAPKTDEQKTLYALGAVIARNLGNFALTPSDLKLVQMGMRDAVAEKPLQADVAVYGPKIQELERSRVAVKAEGEKKKAKVFLDKAAKEKGAQVTASGLIFSELKAGSKEKPKDTDVVRVHYHGTLTDGTVFDSSVERNQPAEFGLNGVIPCWTEGVQKIGKGGKAKLVCPSSIAYGDQGAPPRIPGGATLVFEVELLDIIKDKKDEKKKG